MQQVSNNYVGYTCSVPNIKRPIGHRWWVTIIEQSECGKYVKVSSGKSVGFGKDRWVSLAECEDLKLIKPRNKTNG